MNYKIDPILYQGVHTLSNCNKTSDCVVYSNNYNKCKSVIKRYNIDIVDFPFINAFGVKLNYQQIIDMANFDVVEYITSSLNVQTQIDVSKNIIELFDVGLTRNFCTVIIDTGVSNIVDLCVPHNRIVHFVDFINNKNYNYDDNGHGTFVASILGGNGIVSGCKYSGIDKMCNIIVIKALDNKGEGGVLNILKAMQWVIDNKEIYNIKVVCMSFGSSIIVNNDPLVLGAEVLWDNGICVVAAAGNSGPEMSSIKSPGASSKIITVGAINDFRKDNKYNIENFEVADFSSRGPVLGNYKPDIVAPGVDIKGACSYALFKNHYKTMSGTSVATPIVAGVCNLLLASNPNLKPNDIKRLLINNAIKLKESRNDEGYGLLNCKNFIF